MKTGSPVVLLAGILAVLAGTVAAEDAVSPSALEVEARALREAGSLWEAEAKFREAAKREPTADRFTELGVTGWMIAERMVRDGSTAAPGGGATVRNVLLEAARSLNRSLEMGETARARVHLGLVKRYLGDERGAAIDLGRAVELSPKDPLALRTAARAAYAREAWPTALSLFDRLAEISPRDPEVWIWVGKTRYKGGQSSRAEEPLVRALRLDPDREEAYSFLRGLYRNRGLHVEMTAALDKVLAVHPESPRALWNLGQTLVDKKDYAAAAKTFEALSRVDDADPEPHAMVAWLEAFHLARPDEALARFERVLESDPKHQLTCDSLDYLARRGMLEEDFARALRALETWCRADPENARAQSNRGLALRRLGRYAESARAYELGRQANPFDPAIVSDLGLLRLAQGRTAEARALFIEALDLDPGFLNSIENLGILARLEGRREDALRWFRRGHAVCDEAGDERSVKFRRYMDLVRYEER